MTKAKPELLSFADADKRLDGTLKATFQGGYATVLLVDGDLAISGDFLPGIGKLAKGDVDVVAITGNLTVTGRIQLYEHHPSLYVGGKTKAETLEGGDSEVYINDGTFTYFVYGYYNDGTLETGTVKTPWVINSDHDLRVTAGKTTKWIDNYGDDDDYDFGSENIAASFVPEVRGKGEDGNAIVIDAFYKRLAGGKPVLGTGAKTGKEAALAHVKGAKTKRKTEVVLTTKKLKAFPKDVLNMPWLTKLVLDGNEIGSVPAGIGKLVDLEELSLQDCGLAELPASVGKLTKLRVLRVGGNITFPSKGTHAITLPASIGNLVNLEELDVSGLSTSIDGQEDRPLPDMIPYALPAAIAKLTKLRVLRAEHTNLVLPKAAWKLPIEELDMGGSSWCYLKEFPPFITSLTRLRKLDLNTNYFRSIPSLDTLTQLRELDLGNALGFVKKLPDLSKLQRLQVLRLSGNTGRTNVPEPGHAVLKPLFAMDLPALEELRIDRWGEKEDVKRPDLPADLLRGIGTFRALKKLDLEFDGLAKLPADFYELTALEELKLDYNHLPKPELAKLKKAFPKATIDVGHQR